MKHRIESIAEFVVPCELTDAQVEEVLNVLGGKPVTIEGEFHGPFDPLEAMQDRISERREFTLRMDLTPRILRPLARLKIIPRRWATTVAKVSDVVIAGDSFNVTLKGQPRKRWRIRWGW